MKGVVKGWHHPCHPHKKIGLAGLKRSCNPIAANMGGLPAPRCRILCNNNAAAGRKHGFYVTVDCPESPDG